MFKKIIFLSFLFSFFFFTGVAHAGEASVQISPLQANYNKGETFIVKVWVKTGEYALGHISVDISFSEDFLQVISVKMSDVFKTANKYGINSYDNEKGNVHIEGEIGAGLREDGSLATITFKAENKGTARVELFKTTRIFTADGLAIPLRTADGMYQLEEKDNTSGVINSAKQESVVYKETEEGDYDGISNGISTSSVLIGQPPQLVGKSDTPGARVEFDVDDGLIIDKTTADQQGEWNWSLPKRLLPGIYAVKISAYNPQDRSKRKVDWQEVEMRVMDVSRQLFKIMVVSSTLPKYVYPDSKLPLSLKITNLGNTSSSQQLKNTFSISYYVEDASHGLIYDNQEEVVFSGQDLILNREVEIPKEAVKGDYTIYATMKLDSELISMDSTTFKVRGKLLKYLIIGGLLAIVVIAAWALFKRMKK